MPPSIKVLKYFASEFTPRIHSWGVKPGRGRMDFGDFNFFKYFSHDQWRKFRACFYLSCHDKSWKLSLNIRDISPTPTSPHKSAMEFVGGSGVGGGGGFRLPMCSRSMFYIHFSWVGVALIFAGAGEMLTPPQCFHGMQPSHSVDQLQNVPART